MMFEPDKGALMHVKRPILTIVDCALRWGGLCRFDRVKLCAATDHRREVR